MIERDAVFIKNNKKVEICNNPAAFDIETSSFYLNGNKQACMYIWQFGFNGDVIYGRTWEEFISLMRDVVLALDLSVNKKLLIYVHNLSYEFQWIKEYFKWDAVFALKSRKVCYAKTIDGLEFRCSYILSGFGLNKVGQDLQKYKVTKKVGQLDYSQIRLPTTHISAEELEYCIDDVRVVMAYIQERLERDGNMTKVLLTKTSYVRKYCRSKCLYKEDDAGHRKSRDKFLNYRKIMNACILDLETYKLCRRAFQGGFTHASALHTFTKLYDVDSVDECSCYPTMCVCKLFPYGEGEYVSIEDVKHFKKLIKLYCCIFDIVFINLRPKIIYENYISYSHCWKREKVILNNGRVVSADCIGTTITNVDFEIIEKFYTWDEIKIYRFKRWKKRYLPKDLIIAILQLYSDKTTLKGVVGREDDYMSAKNDLNAVYGCMVTDICRNDVKYSARFGWSETSPNFDEELTKYNDATNRFLFYPWGVFVTAYARQVLMDCIIEFGEDYVYADTDSVKGFNIDKHKEYLENYNARITRELDVMCEKLLIAKELIKPKTIKGKEKPLGIFEYEGRCTEFKTLGAKRYMYLQDAHYNLTVSGVNKKSVIPFLEANYKNPIDAFDEGLYIPKGQVGKMIHTYIDEECSGHVTDYLGKEGNYYERSFIHLEPADYSFSIAENYVNYIKNLRTEEK